MRSGGFVKSQALQIEHGSVVQGQFRGPHHVCVMATALPDLIPADHSVWSISEARVCAKRHHSLQTEKESLRRERNRLSPDNVGRKLHQAFGHL